jgi:hypothetical protein
MYGAAPEFAQQNPCHSASDGGPNGGRTCPRHPVAQHLDRDKHNECDYGGEQNATRDNRYRCPISPFHIAVANVVDSRRLLQYPSLPLYRFES